MEYPSGTEEKKLSRREMLENLLAGVAAGAVWPAIASAHPIHQHVKNAGVLDRADTIHKAAVWKPLFLHCEQSESLIAIAEAIVPGSANARVARFIDLLLSVDTIENQKKFAAALSAIEEQARKGSGSSFHSMSPNQQSSVLVAASADAALSDHFQHLKEWIVSAYYSSEVGMRELGWDGNHAFARFPGCNHGDGRHTGIS